MQGSSSLMTPEGSVRDSAAAGKAGAGREGPAGWLLFNDLDNRADRALCSSEAEKLGQHRSDTEKRIWQNSVSSAEWT